MKTTLITAVLLTLSALPMTATSDVLLIDAITESAPNSMDGLPRPTRSMNMDAVKAKFGEPSGMSGPVGEPPITRWDYDGYSVYFEHDLVLNTVVHR